MGMSTKKRWMVGLMAVLMLASTYVLQRSQILMFFKPGAMSPSGAFILSRSIRLIINDLACILLIKSLFLDRKYVRLALSVFLIELLVLLPGYLAVKLSLEGPTEISSPALAQVHRLIVNPLLMFLLIMGVVYSRLKEKGTGIYPE